VLAVAAYFPLYAVPFAGRLLTMPWPEPISAILVQQLVEPEEEARLRDTIPRATSIENAISQRVQTQYEENPYPRWVRAAPAGTANTIIGYLSKRFPLAPFQRKSKSEMPEFLSAGCGTGQLATEFAQGIIARVLAVDLSLSSLG
jgi:SAM-dependent methyltransferase